MAGLLRAAQVTLFIDHDGFDLSDPYQAASRRILGAGWPAMPGNISAVLAEEGLEESLDGG